MRGFSTYSVGVCAERDGDRERGARGIHSRGFRARDQKKSCSLVGTAQRVNIAPGTIAHQAYQAETALEEFRCSYGLNQAYRDQIVRSGIRVAGMDAGSEVRAIELPNHPFFLLPRLLNHKA